MASSLSTRMVGIYKAARRPLPTFSEDDVLDYMVMEAVIYKHFKHEEDSQKDQEKENWKKDFSKLEEAANGPKQ